LIKQKTINFYKFLGDFEECEISSVVTSSVGGEYEDRKKKQTRNSNDALFAVSGLCLL